MRGATKVLSLFPNTLLTSIHAPHAGYDTADQRVFSAEEILQSTHPMRGATKYGYRKADALKLQSTRPHGARLLLMCANEKNNFNPRAHTGRDKKANEVYSMM